MWLTHEFLAYREISATYLEVISNFRRAAPHLEFPALHKELFPVS